MDKKESRILTIKKLGITYTKCSLCVSCCMYQEYLYGVDNMESFKHNIGILFSLYKIEYGFEISENKY